MEKNNINFNGIDDSDDTSMSSVGHMIVHEDPQSPEDSSDSAYEADTIIDSPNSSSSTLLLNVSDDSNDQNAVSDNDVNEVKIVEEPPAPAALMPHTVVNCDEAGYYCHASHGSRLFNDFCQGCACKCHGFKFGSSANGLSSDSDDTDRCDMPVLEGLLEGCDEDDGDKPPLINELSVDIERLHEEKEETKEDSEEDL